MFEQLQAWFSIPTNVTLVATVVIALATLGNVWVSYRIARAARRSADASKAVADVTRANFDVAHRPYFAIAQVQLECLEPEGDARITILTRNYGDVPLRITNHDIRAMIADPDRPEKPPYATRFLPTGSGVVLPADETVFYSELTDPWLSKILTASDVEQLRVIADLIYVSLANIGEYRSQSKHKYNPELRVFETIESKMT